MYAVLNPRNLINGKLVCLLKSFINLFKVLSIKHLLYRYLVNSVLIRTFVIIKM